MIKSKKQLPKTESNHHETIKVELEQDKTINITIEVTDSYLMKFPAVKEGIIPEALLNEFTEKVLTNREIKDGDTFVISTIETTDTDVDCMITKRDA